MEEGAQLTRSMSSDSYFSLAPSNATLKHKLAASYVRHPKIDQCALCFNKLLSIACFGGILFLALKSP